MSASHLSVDDLSALSKGQVPFELAAALVYPSLAPQDAYPSSSASYPTRQDAFPAYPSAGYHYVNDQPSTFSPAGFPSGDISLHDAIAEALVTAQLQQHPPSPPSHMHYPVRWPAADNFGPFNMAHGTIGPSVHQDMPLLHPQAAVAPESAYQPLPPDAHRSAAQPAWSVSGSLDPVTGVFQRSSEHPRMRTAQACEKCRIRKAKCSGEHPFCQRCRSRGLLCEYAPERRMRGPNKNKRKSVSGTGPDRRSSTPHSERRMSVASTSSSSSEADHPVLDIPPAVVAAVVASAAHSPELISPSPFVDPARPHSHPSPLRFGLPEPIEPIPVHTPEQQHIGRRPRPPPLNLDSASFFPALPSGPSEHTVPASAVPAGFADDTTPTVHPAARRASLPAYLAVTPSAGDGAPASFSPSDSVPPTMDTLSVHSHSRSNSNSNSTPGSLHAPLTPLSLPDSMPAHGDIAYPGDFDLGTLGAVEHGKEGGQAGFDQTVADVLRSPLLDPAGKPPGVVRWNGEVETIPSE
ncbi:uncharacterized protein FIBRA_01961 [Fibroporia radiculosa]|uniref:Zn(2)-C6 fungal-type domain-containing protein n=1 Tax=Fibroporia radiculosa TaxID=599839 RepID=J4I8S8_9APHY|nr:uncharacterized protein FIBRA_01961 [Fibroporia radiculosa]CCL99936.1 predicted protein [Fibroporia radiculosa]